MNCRRARRHDGFVLVIKEPRSVRRISSARHLSMTQPANSASQHQQATCSSSHDGGCVATTSMRKRSQTAVSRDRAGAAWQDGSPVRTDEQGSIRVTFRDVTPSPNANDSGRGVRERTNEDTEANRAGQPDCDTVTYAGETKRF